jgi:predicted O-methyltransferase YrrM
VSKRTGIADYLVRSPVGRLALMPVRLRIALSYYTPQLAKSLLWVGRSRELSNFSYRYTPRNLEFLAHTLSVVTDRPAAEVRAYLAEPSADVAMHRALADRRGMGADAALMDNDIRLGRQLAWYALVRLLRPRLVVETGVGHGLSGVLVCHALRRNAASGASGTYVGVDLDPGAGVLLGDRYGDVARVITGDSRAVLGTLGDPIDIFISDSHVSPEVEYAECVAVAPTLAPGAIVATTVSDRLPQFAEETGRRCVVFREEPEDHWYPGAWIGFAYATPPVS